MFEASKGKFFKDGTTSLSAEETARLRDLNIRLSDEDRAMAADFPQPSKPFPPYTELRPALESGIAKAVPTEVDDEAERLIRAERERVLKLQALNKMQEPTVSPAEELQSVTGVNEFAEYADQYTEMRKDRIRDAKREEMTRKLLDQPDSVQGSGGEGSIFGAARDYITDLLLDPKIQGKINSAIEQSQAATADAVQKRVGPAIAASEDAVQALGRKEAIDAMDARNEAGPYRITAPVKTEVDPVGPDVVFDVLQSASDAINPDESFVPRKDRGTVITADSGGSGTVSADPLKAVVPIAKTATEVAAAMAGLGDDVLGDNPDYSGQVESGTAKESSTRPPSFRRNADGVLITDDTQDSAEDLLKELSAERATNEQDQRQVEMEEEGDKKVVSRPVAPKIAPAVTDKITTLGADAGMGQGFGGDGSIADLTKDYTKLLKSLLGESDEDKAARKGELFMLMGAALMSGKSSNALTNIGGALQIGAKAAIQDRTTRKKREDTIGLKGFELAADRISKREATAATIDSEKRAFKRDKLLLVERLKNAKDLAEFNSLLGNTYIKSGPYKSLKSEYTEARKTFLDISSDISKEDRELGFANYFTKLMLESAYDPLDIQTFNLYQGRSGLPTTSGGGGQSLDDIK